MSVIRAETTCKDSGFFNGTTGKIKMYDKSSLHIQSDKNFIPIFPVHTDDNILYYPIKPSYATTVYKIQGQTFPHVTLVFDRTSGIGYVVISRVACFNHANTLLKLYRSHFTPVQTISVEFAVSAKYFNLCKRFNNFTI